MVGGRSGSYSFEEKNFGSSAEDKSIDDDTRKKSDLTEIMGSGVDEVDYAKQVEPEIERKRRYFSLAIITFTAFTFNLSFSIILISAKPYLDQMDPEAGTQFLGLFIATQPLAQLFFSPLLGYSSGYQGGYQVVVGVER